MKTSDTPDEVPNVTGCLVTLVILVVLVVGMIFWPTETMGVVGCVCMIIGVLVGLVGGGPLGVIFGALAGVATAVMVCGPIYFALTLFGWQPPEEIEREAQIASARADYIMLSEQLEKQPAVDAARRELIWEIWEKAPERAREIIEAARAEPPKIPTTRDLLAVLEAYPTKPHTDAAVNMRWDERRKVESEKKYAAEKQIREKREREEAEQRKRQDVLRRIEQKDPARAKQLRAMPSYHGVEKPTYEELLDILAEIEEREAARSIGAQ